ncbi:hypothetical protein, partial [Salmonella sp. s54234]|uniref:hypothetical protein n=1 Tax=Salmonella sp. s54234 TaxID=3159663 RepID=UPI0039810A4F
VRASRLESRKNSPEHGSAVVMGHGALQRKASEFPTWALRACVKREHIKSRLLRKPRRLLLWCCP